jgi:hypothetical protein
MFQVFTHKRQFTQDTCPPPFVARFMYPTINVQQLYQPNRQLKRIFTPACSFRTAFYRNVVGSLKNAEILVVLSDSASQREDCSGAEWQCVTKRGLKKK